MDNRQQTLDERGKYGVMGASLSALKAMAISSPSVAGARSRNGSIISINDSTRQRKVSTSSYGPASMLDVIDDSLTSNGFEFLSNLPNSDQDINASAKVSIASLDPSHRAAEFSKTSGSRRCSSEDVNNRNKKSLEDSMSKSHQALTYLKVNQTLSEESDEDDQSSNLVVARGNSRSAEVISDQIPYSTQGFLKPSNKIIISNDNESIRDKNLGNEKPQYKSLDELSASRTPGQSRKSYMTEESSDERQSESVKPSKLDLSIRGGSNTPDALSPTTFQKKINFKSLQHQGILKARMTPSGVQDHYFYLDNRQLYVYKGISYRKFRLFLV